MGLPCFPHNVELDPQSVLPLVERNLKRLALDDVAISLIDQLPPGFAARTIWNTRTLLCRCLERFDHQRARQLLQDGADPNVLLPDGVRPLWCCASVEALRFLIEEAGVDLSLHIREWSSGVVAAFRFSPPMLQYFFFDGPHVARLEAQHEAPFFSADMFARDSAARRPCTFRWTTDSVQFILGEKFIAKYGNPALFENCLTGETPLHFACRESSFEAANVLLKLSNSSLTTKNKRGFLPAHCAGDNRSANQWAQLDAEMKRQNVPIDLAVRVTIRRQQKKCSTSFFDLVCSMARTTLLQLAFEKCEPDLLLQLLTEIREVGSRRGFKTLLAPVFFQLAAHPILHPFLQQTLDRFGDKMPPSVWQCESIFFAKSLLQLHRRDLFLLARRFGMRFSMRSLLFISRHRAAESSELCSFADLTPLPAAQDFSRELCTMLEWSTDVGAAILDRALSDETWHEIIRACLTSCRPLRLFLTRWTSQDKSTELEPLQLCVVGAMERLQVGTEVWAAAISACDSTPAFHSIQGSCPIASKFYERLKVNSEQR